MYCKDNLEIKPFFIGCNQVTVVESFKLRLWSVESKSMTREQFFTQVGYFTEGQCLLNQHFQRR